MAKGSSLFVCLGAALGRQQTETSEAAPAGSRAQARHLRRDHSSINAPTGTPSAPASDLSVAALPVRLPPSIWLT